MTRRFRDRAEFQRLDTTPDEYGNVTAGTWATVLTMPCEFRPERSRERLEAGRLESSVAGTLRLRSNTASRAITAADRVRIDGVPYQIRAIMNPDRRGHMLEMMVERGVGT